MTPIPLDDDGVHEFDKNRGWMNDKHNILYLLCAALHVETDPKARKKARFSQILCVEDAITWIDRQRYTVSGPRRA